MIDLGSYARALNRLTGITQSEAEAAAARFRAQVQRAMLHPHPSGMNRAQRRARR